MTTVNALSVALFNAAAGGYSADMAKNPAAYAAAVGAVLEKDLSSDAAFVEHVLANFGVATTSAVYADAKAALTGMVNGQGRVNATVNAINFLADQKVGSAYAAIATAFAAKVATAAAFSTANAKELDVSKLIAAVTGVDTDVVATDAAFAAGAASRNTEVADLKVSVAALTTELAAVKAAAAEAAAKAAADAAAAKTAADAALAAANTAAAEAAAKAAADAAAAKTAADAALAAANTAAAEAAAAAAAELAASEEALAAANATITLINDTDYASEQAAYDAAEAAGAAALAAANTAAAAALAAAEAAAATAAAAAAAEIAALEAEVEALENPDGGSFVLTTGTDTAFGVSGGDDAFTGTDLTYNTADLIVDGNSSDNDTLTINVVTKGVNAISETPVVAGFENFVVNFAGFGTATLDATNIRGADITVNQTQVGGSTAATVNSVGDGLTVTTGSTITGTVTIDGVDNGDVTLNTKGTTIVVEDGGALENVTINATGGSSSTAVSVDTDADVSVSVTASATGDLKIDAVAAVTVNATNSAGSIQARTGVNGDDLTAATSITLTAKDEIIIDTKAAKSVTLSAGGTTTDSSVIDNGNVLVTANLSGNGAAVDFDMTGADKLSTINFTGSQSVRAILSLADIDGLTGDKLTTTDTTTAGTTTLQLGTAVGTAVLTSAVVDVVDLAIDNKGKSLTLASGQTLLVSVDQTNGGTTTIDGADASAATNELTINLFDGDSTDAGAVDLDVVTFTDLNAVVINADIDTKVASRLDTLDGSADNTNITINAGSKGLTIEGTNTIGTGDLVINSSGAVTMTSVGLTAGSFTASGAGAVTWDNIDSSTTATVTTGSGKDVLTLAGSSENVTISTGGGDDSVTITKDGDATANKSISIDMGDGTLDTVVFGDKADMTASGASFTMTNVERLDFDGAVTIGAAALTGQSYIVKNTGTAEAVVTVELATATRTVDLSSLEIDTGSITAAKDYFVITGSGANSLTLTGANAAVNHITGGSAADLITGGAEADQLTGGAGDDSIVAGEGKDGVYGGTGADVIDLTESTSVADVIVFAALDEGSAVGAAGGTFSDFDTIAGFKAGTDKLVFDAAAVDFDTTVGTKLVSAGETAQLKAGTAATAAVNDITLANYTSVDQVVNFIADAGTALSFTASKVNLLAVTLGSGTSGTTVIYGIDNDATAAVAADEIYLIGTVNGVLTIAADFVYA